jgi:hypothetical protein
MSQKYPGGFITKSPVAPTASAASGVWTIDQAMQLQKQGLWPAPPPAIGAAYGGGFFAGQISTAGNGIADYNIVVGPFASANSASKQWKTSATSTAGTTSPIDGPANSAAMNNASHPAAEFCEAVNVGGFTDWYMPARYELEVCYYNLKPTTQGNTASSGGNPYSVPTRSGNYGAGDPAQTTAALFIVTTGAQAFEATTAYWSSTQGSSTGAWKRGFYSGYQYNSSKTYSYNVRAIRRIAV